MACEEKNMSCATCIMLQNNEKFCILNSMLVKLEEVYDCWLPLATVSKE